MLKVANQMAPAEPAQVDAALRTFRLAADDAGASQAQPTLFAETGTEATSSTTTLVDEVAVGEKLYTRYINEFWTARQRGGHSLHEISYRACFKAELPRFFLSLLCPRGEAETLVYDPFMGRGTTLLEAALAGCRVAGNDANPLSEILLRPRLEVPPLERIVERLEALRLDAPAEEPDIDLSMFYARGTLRQLMNLRTWLNNRRQAGEEDAADRWIRMVATNRLSGHSSGFFSVYTLPPNQAVSPQRQREINARRNQTPSERDVKAIILKKTRSLLRRLTAQQARQLRNVAQSALLMCEDAGNTPKLADESVDVVVTSPPFLNTVQYAQDNWLRCWFNGLNAESIARRITVTSSLQQWRAFIGSVMQELHRVVRPGGWVAFEVGEVRGGTLNLDEVVAPLGEAAGFRCVGLVINSQHFTKTANCWGVDNNAKGTNTNRIVLLWKEPA